MKKKILILLFLILTFPAFSQVGSLFSTKIEMGVPLQLNRNIYQAPLVDLDFRTYFYNQDEALFQYGFDFNINNLDTIIKDESLLSFELAGLFSIYHPFSQRLNLRGDFTIGGNFLQLQNYDQEDFTELYGTGYGFNLVTGLDVNFGLYTSPNTIFNFGVGLKSSPCIYNEFKVGTGFAWHIPPAPPLLSIDAVQSANILPVFYEFYTENPVFKIKVTNNERFPIKKLILNVPKTSISNKYKEVLAVHIKPGETQEILIPFKLNETILNNTKSYSDSLTIMIKYKAGSKARKSKMIATFTIMERNSFIWQTQLDNNDESALGQVITANDGKVAVFVNPNDEKMIDLAHKIQTSYTDEVGFDDLSYNMKSIYKVISYLQSLNIKYQTDPNTVPYGNKNFAVDYLKFPAETLKTACGDCDDLSILFAQLLESSGVHCGFITVPGHIFLAADSGMTEESIYSLFGNSSRFIYHKGTYYVPIEVTVTKDGLTSIWNMGIKEWTDCEISERDFFPLEEAWKNFKPVKMDLISDISIFYPQENFINYQLTAKQEIAAIAMEKENNDILTLSETEIDYARIAKKEYKLGLLEEAFSHMQNAIILKPTVSNYYNAALIAYRMDEGKNDAIYLLKEGAKLSDNMKNKPLYKNLVSDKENNILMASAKSNQSKTQKAKEEKRAAEIKEELKWQD